MTLRMTDGDRYQASENCRSHMMEIGRRFDLLDASPKTVFEPWNESRCYAVKAWTCVFNTRKQNCVDDVKERDVSEAVVSDSQRVPRWWQCKEWDEYDARIAYDLGYSRSRRPSRRRYSTCTQCPPPRFRITCVLQSPYA